MPTQGESGYLTLNAYIFATYFSYDPGETIKRKLFLFLLQWAHAIRRRDQEVGACELNLSTWFRKIL